MKTKTLGGTKDEGSSVLEYNQELRAPDVSSQNRAGAARPAPPIPRHCFQTIVGRRARHDARPQGYGRVLLCSERLPGTRPTQVTGSRWATSREEDRRHQPNDEQRQDCWARACCSPTARARMVRMTTLRGASPVWDVSVKAVRTPRPTAARGAPASSRPPAEDLLWLVLASIKINEPRHESGTQVRK